MKAVEWMRFLADQRRRHGKGVFTVTELPNVAHASPAVMNVELGRLVRQGVIRRWVPGRYGLPEGVAVEELATAIDADAYVTGAYALARHGFITQMPWLSDCFTLRRRSLEPHSLYTFRKLDQLEISSELLACYPTTVQRAVQQLLG